MIVIIVVAYIAFIFLFFLMIEGLIKALLCCDNNSVILCMVWIILGLLFFLILFVITCIIIAFIIYFSGWKSTPKNIVINTFYLIDFVFYYLCRYFYESLFNEIE